MTFEEAIRKSVKAYWKGKTPENLKKSVKQMKYTKKYFDRFEKETFGEAPSDEDDKKRKGKK